MSVFQAGQRITAATLNAFCAPAAVIKPADQSVTSSTVLVNDNALVLPVVASATYLFEFYLNWESVGGAGNGIKWQWTVPAGATLRFGFAGQNAAGNQVASATNTDSQVFAQTGGGAAALQGTFGTGTLIMSSTAGNLQLQWAQNASSGTPAIVHAQSKVVLQRIS